MGLYRKQHRLFYIDTGYFGNQNTKQYHRIAYNNLQTLNHLSKEEIEDRLSNFIIRNLQCKNYAKRYCPMNLKEREYHEKEKY